LHLGLALLASLGVHAVFLFAMQGGAVTGHEHAQDIRVSLTYASLRFPTQGVTVEPRIPLLPNLSEGLHSNKISTEPDKEPATVTSWFSWHPKIYPDKSQPSLSDPAQAAMAAQMRQFKILALMESLTEVATDMAPNIEGEHVCKMNVDSSVICDVPFDFAWNDKLTNWLALQTQLQVLAKGNVPLTINGKHGNLILQLSTEQHPDLAMAQRDQ
jgi:hypothetical protein